MSKSDRTCLTFLVPELISDRRTLRAPSSRPSPEPTRPQTEDETSSDSWLPPSLRKLLEEEPPSSERCATKSWRTTVSTFFRRIKSALFSIT